ncbi:MAG: amino acid ABC transporter permease [Gammaproteobacteria bacterium]
MAATFAQPSLVVLRLRATAKALFGSPLNALITLAMLALFAKLLPALYQWAISLGTVAGDNRQACLEGGACWVFIRIRFHNLMYGDYPAPQVWRVNVAGLALIGLIIGAFLRQNPWRKQFVLLLVFAYPVLALALIVGGFPRLPAVETRLWGGLMLNVVLAYVTVLGAVPLGLLLAEARRSKDASVRLLATGFIELWRAAPLVTVLFMGIVVLPLMMPHGFEMNKFVGVAGALVLFNSAYMAEAIRGGLQAVPAGQFQAANALGLGFWQARYLIVWPQALRMSVPSIVNTAIDLFKDTSLVIILGLFDLLGSVQQATRDPHWLGLESEGYFFVAAIFFIICTGLSMMSKAIERELNAPEHRHHAPDDTA